MDGAIVLDETLTILRAASPAGARPDAPHRRVRHPASHGRAGGPADRLPGRLGQQVDAHHRGVRRGAATCSRTPRRSCPGPTRRWRPWSGTSSDWTRSPARSRRWRSRTWSRSATHAVAQRAGDGPADRDEIAGYIVELGTDGRLLSLQLDELVAGRAAAPAPRPRLRALATRREPRRRGDALAELADLADDLLDFGAVAGSAASAAPRRLDDPVSPRGYRLLARCPGCPARSSTAWSTLRWAAEAAGRERRRPAAGRGCRQHPGRASARVCPGWPSRP